MSFDKVNIFVNELGYCDVFVFVGIIYNDFCKFVVD